MLFWHQIDSDSRFPDWVFFVPRHEIIIPNGGSGRNPLKMPKRYRFRNCKEFAQLHLQECQKTGVYLYTISMGGFKCHQCHQCFNSISSLLSNVSITLIGFWTGSKSPWLMEESFRSYIELGSFSSPIPQITRVNWSQLNWGSDVATPLPSKSNQQSDCEIRWAMMSQEQNPLALHCYWLFNRDPYFMIFEIILCTIYI